MSVSEVGNKKPVVQETPKAPEKKAAEPQKSSEEATKVTISTKEKSSDEVEAKSSDDSKQAEPAAPVKAEVKKYQDVQDSLST